MAALRQFKDLTQEQQKQLTALLTELDSHPTGEAIVACREAMGADLGTDEGLALADQALAGAWAFDRIIPYLLELRRLNEERLRLGEMIYHQKRVPYPTQDSEVVAKAQAEVMASHNAGSQEVVFNLFCICVQHIRSFLMIAAEAVGYPIDSDDLAFLDEFRHLRNHYEHMYNRLPGKPNELALLTKEVKDGTYRVRGGLDVDGTGNILVVELKKGGVAITHTVELTRAGMERIERIVEETWSNLKLYALNQVREHFIADLSYIPPPESIAQGMLLKAGGYHEDAPADAS